MIVAEKPAAGLVHALTSAGAFPVVEARWSEAAAAVASIQPAAVVVAEPAPADHETVVALGQRIAAAQPHLPVIARVQDDESPLAGALPIAADAPVERLIARLAAALRVRALHATVLRRASALAAAGGTPPALASSDPLEDASVLVLGRGRSYPTLSVAVGERVGVIGALSVEAAGRCLNAREIDGIVIGDGFGARVIEAFLIVLAEDARFRDLPVGVLGAGTMPAEMPNIERERDPARLVARTLSLVRLHAFAARLKRMAKSLERQGLIDPQTSLLTFDAFVRDLAQAIDDAFARDLGLSLARVSFSPALDRRASLDAARLISRLIRSIDFACLGDDGALLVAFAETDLRAAHVVARRLASVLKHTMLRSGRVRAAVDAHVTVATLKPADTAHSLMARVVAPAVAAE